MVQIARVLDAVKTAEVFCGKEMFSNLIRVFVLELRLYSSYTLMTP